MKWESPRGPISIDPETRDIVQNIYIRKVEKVDGELYNVEFADLRGGQGFRQDEEVTRRSAGSAAFGLAPSASCPGLSRASTSFFAAMQEDVDGRDKPGHDAYSLPRDVVRIPLNPG